MRPIAAIGAAAERGAGSGYTAGLLAGPSRPKIDVSQLEVRYKGLCG